MQQEFDENLVNNLIEEALSKNTENPFGGSVHLGLAESDLLQNVYERLTKRFTETYLNDIFQEVRIDILSRKLSTSLKDVHTVTRNCKKCNIPSVAELPKWNVENPDIVVVVESPSISQEAIDIMVNTFKKVGLSSQQLCLTYVNRCPVKRKYENSEILNCSPYLHTEIQLLNPRLIVCLGVLPSTVLFGTPLKLKDVRGEIRWLGYWPVLMTYSPQYVIKSLEVESNFVIEQFETDILQAFNFVNKPSKIAKQL